MWVTLTNNGHNISQHMSSGHHFQTSLKIRDDKKIRKVLCANITAMTKSGCDKCGFSFQADWLKKWREFSRPIIERRIAETWQSRITFDTRLTSLTPWRDYYLISPYNITLESHIKVTRIKKKNH